MKRRLNTALTAQTALHDSLQKSRGVISEPLWRFFVGYAGLAERKYICPYNNTITITIHTTTNYLEITEEYEPPFQGWSAGSGVFGSLNSPGEWGHVSPARDPSTTTTDAVSRHTDSTGIGTKTVLEGGKPPTAVEEEKTHATVPETVARVTS